MDPSHLAESVKPRAKVGQCTLQLRFIKSPLIFIFTMAFLIQSYSIFFLGSAGKVITFKLKVVGLSAGNKDNMKKATRGSNGKLLDWQSKLF